MYRGLQLAVAAGAGGGRATRTSPVPQTSMDVEFTQLSYVGRGRQGNEDYLGHVAPASPDDARARGWLFAVADGVGGHDLGEVASRTAIESLVEGFQEATPGELHSPLLTRLVQKANTRVLDAAH